MLERARASLLLAAVAAVTAAVAVPIDGAGAADMTAVLVRDSNFAPAHTQIRAGDSVIFSRTKDTQLDHTVTSDNGAFDVEIKQGQAYRFSFSHPGSYPYHCKFHGSAGMTGVILVEDTTATTTTSTGPGATTTTTPTTGPTTTTSTAPTTTTTTSTAPTTTTTKPPKTTTTTTTAPPPPPPTTTTTAAAPPPMWEPPPPDPAPPAGPAANPPPAGRPASTTTTAPKGRPADKDNKDRGAAAAKPPAAPPSTTGTMPPAPPPPDPAALAAAEALAIAAAAAANAAPPPDAAVPGPNEAPAVEPLDPAILDTLAAATGEKAPDNGSKLLLVAGLALGLLAMGTAAWAWYHRSSRYMPA
jgi:plastocyanin